MSYEIPFDTIDDALDFVHAVAEMYKHEKSHPNISLKDNVVIVPHDLATTLEELAVQMQLDSLPRKTDRKLTLN